MKKALSFIMPMLFVSQTLLSQTTSPLRIDPQPLKTGKPVKITYQAGVKSAFYDRDTLICQIQKIYNLKYENSNYPKVENLKLIKIKDKHETSLLLNDSTIAISISILDTRNTMLKDDNKGAGYKYVVHSKKNLPVPGALVYLAASYRSADGSDIYKDSLFNEEYKVNPSSRKDVHVLARHYLSKVQSGDSVLLKGLVDDLRRSLRSNTKPDEYTIQTVARVLANERLDKEVDSLKQLAIARFPQGNTAKRELSSEIRKTNDPQEIQRLFEKAQAFFTPYKNDDLAAINDVQRAFANKGFLPGIKFFADKGNVDLRANMYNSYAWYHAERGTDLDSALLYSKKSLDMLAAERATLTGLANSRRIEDINNMFHHFADTYAMILMKKGRLAEALEYQEKAVNAVKKPNGSILENYATILEKNGRRDEARKVAEEVFMTKETRGRTALLKSIYQAEHGSEDGFKEYITALRASVPKFRKDKMAAEMIKEQAPLFVVKNLEGETVSLADLKGKVVVLDFWATWCGPCVASFPGMAAAQEKLKANDDVVFLFINTWENKPELARKFIQNNKYDFKVVMDNYNEGTGKYSTATDYNVEGIPTKFIIDKEGNIRFRKVGSNSSLEGTVEELSSMIELLR